MEFRGGLDLSILSPFSATLRRRQEERHHCRRRLQTGQEIFGFLWLRVRIGPTMGISRKNEKETNMAIIENITRMANIHRNIILQADCICHSAHASGSSIDFIFSDPPLHHVLPRARLAHRPQRFVIMDFIELEVKRLTLAI